MLEVITKKNKLHFKSLIKEGYLFENLCNNIILRCYGRYCWYSFGNIGNFGNTYASIR